MLENVVVIYLGGMDFFIVLYKVLRVGKKVYVFSFDYGQCYKKEFDYVVVVCMFFGVFYKIVDISVINILIGGFVLMLDIDVFEGYYEELSMK